MQMLCVIELTSNKACRCLPRYVPEGNMTACGTDYLTKDWFSRSYILVYSIFVYFLPLLTIIYSYTFILSVRISQGVIKESKLSGSNH